MKDTVETMQTHAKLHGQAKGLEVMDLTVSVTARCRWIISIVMGIKGIALFLVVLDADERERSELALTVWL